MTSRRLKPEEKQIWDKVARTVTPRMPGSAKPQPRADREDFSAMMRIAPVISFRTPKPDHDLDRNADRKTRRGRIEIDFKIDLHDQTRDQARIYLIQSLIRAANKNHKTVLVVTGKGVQLSGIIRNHFIDWLHAPEIRPLIANYAQAHIRHGGNGAWYVFLKR